MLQVDTRGGEVMRIQPRTNEDVNEEWISDKTRCSPAMFPFEPPIHIMPHVYLPTVSLGPFNVPVVTLPILSARRYAVDGLKRQRLDQPLLRDSSGHFSPISWKEAIAIAADKMSSISGAELGVFAGPLVEVEALVALKDLVNKLGSTTTVPHTLLSADLRSTYALNCRIAGIERADALLLVGSNPRIEAPLLNTRIRKMVSALQLLLSHDSCVHFV